MKILSINSYYFSSSVHYSLSNTINNYVNEYLSFVPVSYDYDAKKSRYGQNNKIIIKQCFSKWDRFFFNKKQKHIFKSLKESVNLNNYNLIHAHSLFVNGYIAYKLYLEFDKPYVVTVRDTDINVFFKYRRLLRKIGIKVLKNAEKVIFLSNTYRDYCIKNFVPYQLQRMLLEKSCVIPNGIDKYWIENIFTNRSMVTNKSIRILSVGEVIKRKNHTILDKVCYELNKMGYNPQVTIIGKHTDQKIVRLLNKSKYIELLKVIPKEELINYYRNTDIFILVSITETFGLVYLEALTQGEPVIYTRGQGFDGQFPEGEVGYAVKCNSSKEIARAVQDIIKNYSMISKNTLRNIELFSWENIAGKYMDLYRMIIYEK